MSDRRDIEDQLKMTDADREVSPADRTEAGATTGSESLGADDANLGVLDDVAHPFDQTNGILDAFDETHPGNTTGESASEYAASADPMGDAAPAGDDTGDSYIDDGPGVVPPPAPPVGR